MINTMRETKANMSLQLKNALENFDLAKASLTSAESELESAQENYRITQNQFKQKVATNTDLLDARVMLTRAENTYNNAKFDIHRAVADVERIIEQDI
jgi:outer membrane protein TolC